MFSFPVVIYIESPNLGLLSFPFIFLIGSKQRVQHDAEIIKNSRNDEWNRFLPISCDYI